MTSLGGPGFRFDEPEAVSVLPHVTETKLAACGQPRVTQRLSHT